MKQRLETSLKRVSKIANKPVNKETEDKIVHSIVAEGE